MGVGFYGGGGGSGEAPSITNYDNLTNIPIVNLIGSSAQYFVSLAGLDYGFYKLQGYYKEDIGEVAKETISPMFLQVTQDEQTHNKIITYSSIKDQKKLQHILIYENASLIDHVIQEESFNQKDLYWEED